MERRLHSLTVPALKHLLEANGMKKSGEKKGDLITRILEAVQHGVLPRCPRCKQGYLIADAGSRVYCPGGFDAARREQTKCGFESDAVERPQWRWE